MNASSWGVMWRLLTFRITREELLALKLHDLLVGLFVTWVVGMGRWWDDPAAGIAQRLGLGSVAYIFVLSLFLWLFALPWRIEGMSYRRMLTFVSLTAAPAILYAVPVEMMMSPENAALCNYVALAVVAAWRVALLYVFLERLGALGADRALAVMAVPLSIVVVVLVWMQAFLALAENMSGTRHPIPEANLPAFRLVAILTLFFLVALVALVGGLIFIVQWMYGRAKATWPRDAWRDSIWLRSATGLISNGWRSIRRDPDPLAETVEAAHSGWIEGQDEPPPGESGAFWPVSIWVDMWRLLTFRSSREELLALGRDHLEVGLLVTWLVGMGRWWDDPTAGMAQHLGLGSVAYVFILALFLWLFALPWRIEGMSYERMLTFISLTAAPAILYAIPVEMMMSPESASLCNYGALAVVAAWRVALLYVFLERLGALGRKKALAVMAVPLGIVVFVLIFMHAFFELAENMSGTRHPIPAKDVPGARVAAILFLVFLVGIYGVFSYLVFIAQQLYLHARSNWSGGPDTSIGLTAPFDYLWSLFPRAKECPATEATTSARFPAAASTETMDPDTVERTLPANCTCCGRAIRIGVLCRSCLVAGASRRCSGCGQEILAGSLCQFCQFRGGEGSA